MQITFLGWV